VDSTVDVLDVDRVRETEQEKLQHCMRKWSRGHQHVDALLSVNSDIIIIIITGSPNVVVAKFINMLVKLLRYISSNKNSTKSLWRLVPKCAKDIGWQSDSRALLFLTNRAMLVQVSRRYLQVSATVAEAYCVLHSKEIMYRYLTSNDLEQSFD